MLVVPPSASHMSGAWERMIRSIRRIPGALLQSQALTDEVFLILITEVEGILNSRPLVPIVIDPSADEPLTPNHLLLLRGNPIHHQDFLKKGIAMAKDDGLKFNIWHVSFGLDG